MTSQRPGQSIVSQVDCRDHWWHWFYYSMLLGTKSFFYSTRKYINILFCFIYFI